MAQRAMRLVHTMSVNPSGDHHLGDIPLELSLATLTGENRLYTHRVRIQPDAARLLRQDFVPSHLLESIQNDPAACPESEGAAQVAAILATLSGNRERSDQRPIRYSLNGHADLKLLRNFVWREGHSPQEAEGKTRVVDITHAIVSLSALARVTSRPHLIPEALKGIDQKITALSAEELCRFYGVTPPENSTPAKSLFYLAFAARQADFEVSDKTSVPLRALGSMIEHLEALAGVPHDADAVSESSLRARRLIAPLSENSELTCEDVGLLWLNGHWTPVVQPECGAGQGNKAYFYSLPDGDPIERRRGVSAPVIRMDWLTPPGSQWDEHADSKLRNLCKRDGRSFPFSALAKAFHKNARSWTPPDNAAPGKAPVKANSWVQINEGAPDKAHYVVATQAVTALHNRDPMAFSQALDRLKDMESKTKGPARAGCAVLRKNLRIAGSRGDLINDNRKAWLQQMALQYDPQGWPDEHSPINADSVPKILMGEEAIGKHNRLAISHRVALGISAAPSARAAVHAAPNAHHAAN